MKKEIREYKEHEEEISRLIEAIKISKLSLDDIYKFESILFDEDKTPSELGYTGKEKINKTGKFYKMVENKNDVSFKLIPSYVSSYLENNYPIYYTGNDFYLYNNGKYEVKKDCEIRQIIRNLLFSSHKSSEVYDVFKLLQDSKLYDKNILAKFDSDSNIINLKNGILKVNKEQNKVNFVEHDKSILSTIQFKVDYDENATCELWENTLNEILDKEQIELLQEVMGYFLIPNVKAKKFFLLFGPTDCGKSVILNVLQSLIGENNCSNLTLQKICDTNDRFSTSDLLGKIANICGDLPSKPISDTGTLKMLTGEDFITAERKGKDSFSFKCKAKMIFSCNILPPNYSDKTQAFYNRIQMILFKKTIPKNQQDTKLNDKLKVEYSGILNWMIKGLLRLLNNNLIFTDSQENKEILDTYRENNNPTYSFIKESFEVDLESKIDLKTTYTMYQNHMTECGNSSLSLQNFKNEILTYFSSYGSVKYSKFLRNGKNRSSGIIGIKIKEIDYDSIEKEGKEIDNSNVIVLNKYEQKKLT